jgi:hypothetical protein
MLRLNRWMITVDLPTLRLRPLLLLRRLRVKTLEAKDVEPKPISAIIKRLSSDTVKHFVVLSVGVLSYGTLNYVSLITNCYRSVARFYY